MRIKKTIATVYFMAQVLSKDLDQQLVIQGTWEHFKHIQQGFAETPGVKLSYYKGTIEILMPGLDHERFSCIINYLVSTFLLKQGVWFQMTGSVTQERKREVSAQADESFCLGRLKPIPDLSIAVVFTSGGVNKLAKYRALGVPEVWFWEDGVLKLYHLREEGYHQIDRSELPGLDRLDINLLQRCILIAETDFVEAVQTFQQSI
ncbi:Uma2 family endonuclease [Leptolyngbya sp. DQ-M1]|uniref:Uma2 family endonuclease n=1 Tax=Leptolyngbya sp. DQ-M1 TaxID=2933920 RepID=UPI0032969525